MKLRNKKAWLRTIEAFIAIMIIMSVLIVLLVRQGDIQQEPQEIFEIQEYILERASVDLEIRDHVLSENTTKVEEIAEGIIPIRYNYTVRSCEIIEICSLGFFIDKEVYASETMISANSTLYDPRILKIFSWKR